jgi:plasmid maintenance system antidote protein VapI
MNIGEMLKQKIIACGISRYKISSDTGIEQAALSRLVHGKRTITLETAEILLNYFGFKITKPKAKKAVKK